MESIEKFSSLWDGSEPGWVVVHHSEDREVLHVVFADGGPSVSEVKALRSVVPDLAERAAAEVLALLRGKTEFGLGEFESSSAKVLCKQCKALGLRVASRGYEAISFSLINERSKACLLIEDSATSRDVAEEAMKRGLPIRHSVA
jgi:xanthine/CO dehydrogenase XdhC/CoxF family maturation factor